MCCGSEFCKSIVCCMKQYFSFICFMLQPNSLLLKMLQESGFCVLSAFFQIAILEANSFSSDVAAKPTWVSSRALEKSGFSQEARHMLGVATFLREPVN